MIPDLLPETYDKLLLIRRWELSAKYRVICFPSIVPESINEQKEWKGSDFPLTSISEMTFFFTSMTQKPSPCLVTVAQVLMMSNFL